MTTSNWACSVIFYTWFFALNLGKCSTDTVTDTVTDSLKYEHVYITILR